jgi:hypothetical protein
MEETYHGKARARRITDRGRRRRVEEMGVITFVLTEKNSSFVLSNRRSNRKLGVLVHNTTSLCRGTRFVVLKAKHSNGKVVGREIAGQCIRQRLLAQ